MPSYVLSTGISFETVIIPKGTVLFHGFDTYNEKKNEEDEKTFIYDLFGWPNRDGDLCIGPHHNMFFYASPYVLDVVNRYKVHAIFITNYDLEIISMINPSINTRDKIGTVDKSPYLRCSEITKINECGYRMQNDDPCLSPLLITEYPNIAGYIAIASNDGARYKSLYYPESLRKKKEYAEETVPFVVENARGLISIPEIVLYPYHVRTNLESRTVRVRAPINMFPMNYVLQHRAELNYFPLLYITEDNIYTYKAIMNRENRETIANSERSDLKLDTKIASKMKTVLDRLLSPKGLLINNTKINFSIDLRTGFYICKSENIVAKELITDTISLYRSPLPLEFSSNDKFTVPFEYPANMKRRIQGFLVKEQAKYNTEDEFVETLNKLAASFSRHYQFKKDHPDKYILNYKLVEMFPRPDLDSLYYKNESKANVPTSKRRFTLKKKKLN
jgi:hypothetical protein